MARTIPSAALTEIGKQYGAKPVNIISVQWVKDGSFLNYADKELSDGTPGSIIRMNTIDAVIDISSSSDSQAVEVVLSDTDGTLKDIIDNHDIHKREVVVYQWFEGLSLNDKFVLFRGEVNSPITWNEGDRTLTFSVLSKIEFTEIGFSVEEGNFPSPAPEIVGEPWPLAFGSPKKVPALRLNTPISGTLAQGVGIGDFTLPGKISYASSLSCPRKFVGYTSFLRGSKIIFREKWIEEPSCVLRRCRTVRDLSNQLTQQQNFEHEKIRIIGGNKFPQGQVITLNIGGGKFTGVMDGIDFTIQSREHPDFAEIGTPTSESVLNDILADEAELLPHGCPSTTSDSVSTFQRQREILSKWPNPGFFWANVGEDVVLDGDEEITYVANIIPSTVHTVYAERNFKTGTILAAVPKSLYTVRDTDYGTFTATEIVFDKPLSKIQKGWSDDIYVTLTSDVGPNVVDVLEYLIETYTDFNIDTASFGKVKGFQQKYPVNFALLERDNIVDVLRDIAFQARCAIYLRNNTFFLRYLSEDPTAEGTISESDIEINSLEIFHTPTEELVTKFVALWRPDYYVDDEGKVILRHNVSKYGTISEEFDFFIYNNPELVLKSATFWLIRKSNTWKHLRFNTALNHLNLETFDAVDLNVPDLSPSTIKGLLQSAGFDSASDSLSFEAWTPVKSGETEADPFVFPKDLDPLIFFPTNEDFDEELIGNGQDAPGFNATAPAGHPLAGPTNLVSGFTVGGPCESQTADGSAKIIKSSASFNSECLDTKGDVTPSDQDDTLPPDEEEIADTLELDANPEGPIGDPGEIWFGDEADQQNPNPGGKSVEEQAQEAASAADQAAAGAQEEASEANQRANECCPEFPGEKGPYLVRVCKTEVVDCVEPAPGLEEVWITEVVDSWMFLLNDAELADGFAEDLDASLPHIEDVVEDWGKKFCANETRCSELGVSGGETWYSTGKYIHSSVDINPGGTEWRLLWDGTSTQCEDGDLVITQISDPETFSNQTSESPAESPEIVGVFNTGSTTGGGCPTPDSQDFDNLDPVEQSPEFIGTEFEEVEGTE